MLKSAHLPYERPVMHAIPHSADIHSFEQHGSAFWDKNGPYRTLHHINPARLQFITQYVDLQGKRVLDFGCGGGILSEALADSGARVVGIDLAAAVLEAARAHRGDKAIDYIRASGAELVARGEVFDVVTCMEMLEHVADPAAILRDIHTLLRPGGLVFLSTVNRTPAARLGAICAAEYLLHLVPKGTHQYDWFIRPAELARMVRRAGLTPLAISGLSYNPFTRSARLSRQTAINYFMVARRDPA